MPTAGSVVWYDVVEWPLGPMLLTADGGGLSGLHFESDRHGPRIAPDWVREPARFVDVRRQVSEYFAGTRRQFDVALSLHGTPFQRRVWAALCEIPYGNTISYGELARRLGKPGGARAAGLANGRNPVSIIVPCHRVIGADGSLTGYASGVERKRALLVLEGMRFGQGDLFGRPAMPRDQV